MLMSYTYGMGSISDAEMADEGYPYAMLDGYQSKQKGFLNRYTSAQLYEIDRVVRFLHGIFRWVIGAGADRGISSMRNVCMLLAPLLVQELVVSQRFLQMILMACVCLRGQVLFWNLTKNAKPCLAQCLNISTTMDLIQTS
jgi:hypothetical protein